MKVTERNQLIDDLVDGNISEADFLRLEAEMHISPEVRQAYYDRLKLHTALQSEIGDKGATGQVTSFSRGGRAFKVSALAATLIICSGLIGWQIGRQEDARQTSSVDAEPAREVVVTGYGVVTDASGELFAGGRSVTRGELIPVGEIEMSGDLAQIELFSGVTLNFEGDARFEILSSTEMRMKQGKLQVNVPEPARGFRVLTASGDVVDLGTRFALEVDAEHTDVHVIEGEVEWHPISKPMRLVESGQVVRSSVSGEVETLSDSSSEIGNFDERFESHRLNRREAWSKSAEALSKDERLLTYFPMNQKGSWDRQLIDESSAKRNGTIVRAERVTDRWGDVGHALDFSPTGSRVRVDIPGDHRSMTLFCWIKIDSLDRWYNSLFLTDGHELNEPHWQIMDDGRLFFSVKKRDGKGDKHIAYSPPIWTPAMSGKWMHIATVYDGDAATTTHYVNGEAISTDQIPENMQIEAVRIGAASIGNWSEPKRDDPKFAIRNLNGAMDEFAIFSAALTAEEIREIYQTGKP